MSGRVGFHPLHFAKNTPIVPCAAGTQQAVHLVFLCVLAFAQVPSSFLCREQFNTISIDNIGLIVVDYPCQP